MAGISARCRPVARGQKCTALGCDKVAKYWSGKEPACASHFRRWKKNCATAIIKGCVNCGKSFTTNGQKKLTCSTECSNKWRNGHRRRLKKIEGGAEKLSILEKRRRSSDESKQKQKAYDRSRYDTPEKLEKEKGRWRSYDSRPERKAAKRLADQIRNNSDIGRLRIRRQSSKRRAVVRGNGFEPYEVINIFKRDRFVCQICHGRIPKNQKWPHPLSASIDHIVPVSSGGADAPHNIQSTHLQCNLIKQAKAFGQLFFEGFG